MRDGRAAEVAPPLCPTVAEIDRVRMLGAWSLKKKKVPVKLIARHYGVTRQTIYNWLAAIPADAAPLAV